MGDAGALFLGVIVSVLTIRVNPGISPNWKSLVLMPILLAVPILDTTVAVSSRIYRGLTPFNGGKDHLSHRLVRKGVDHKTAAIILWSGSGLFAVLAIAIFKYPGDLGSLLIYFCALIWISALIYFLRIPSED